MPVNRNALIRYRTLDNCLRNRYRKWTLEDLIDACSEALYEYEGIDKGVSKRTVQMDIQMMRSDKLGYNAPIEVIDKKYYSYADPDYSITNIPLTDQDLGKLTEVVGILKQFKGFTHFKELGGMVERLEDKIHTSKTSTASVIDFEKNEYLKGLDYIDTLYQAVIAKQAIEISYQSFRARQPSTVIFHPYLLKEYRNRWFVLGAKEAGKPLLTLALDRIHAIEESHEIYLENTSLDPNTYYHDVIGVTVNQGDRPRTVRLFVDNSNAPYVITKPLHHTQELIEKTSDGVIIEIKVQLNFELEREILGFGESMKVLSPPKLAKRIQGKLHRAIEQYAEGENKEETAST